MGKGKKKTTAKERTRKTATRTCDSEDEGDKKSQLANVRNKKTSVPSKIVSQNEKVAPSKDEQKLVFNFAKKTLEKGAMGLRAEFQGMKRGNDLSKMTLFVENNAKGRNRYKDVGCLDASRVRLENFPGGDYIHANYVETPCCKKRFICTQAPLEATCADFWHMMIQEGVENIIMLCNITEKGAKKCHEYFATKETPRLQFGEYTVNFVAAKLYKFTCETAAKIRETTLEVEFQVRRSKEDAVAVFLKLPEHCPGRQFLPGRLFGILETTRAKISCPGSLPGQANSTRAKCSGKRLPEDHFH